MVGNDAFGETVDFASRIVGTINGAEIWLSDRAKEDLDRLRAQRHRNLIWDRHDGIEMKGFSGKHTLWSLPSIRPSR